ncbi:sigma 54-interacting transcriptional regulator [uncultured Desulfosarcina sp.]|uniref:sigma 54-interacting transcriptional regulator n=1 Tax=uncultured Desulfosarcina sp. TaxID=218289 RepID=UPI0029C8FBAD|nr:sigma 54-interacting transcriptional regulator [uncultured Desulfosarcina sp.]
MILPIFNTDNAGIFYTIIETMGNASLGLHLSGEKGLGKEAMVRLLYDRSPHRGTPFIKVNCPMLSVPDGNGNTPCFNQVAPRKNVSSFNLFRLFYQGVLYLHSVDEMDMALQGSLLALVNRKFQSSPFSSSRTKGGLLIFSTSTRPLEDCVAAGTFNPKLCELLSGLSIHIPPLHHSPERISPLVDYFLNRFARSEHQDGFTYPSAAHMAMMKTHRWPGNVKELQEIVKTALRLNDWDSAINMLNRTENPMDSYSTVDLSIDGVSLMPDFEIRKGRLLELLEERIPAEEMGLMDLVIYEGAVSPTKMN